MRSSLTAISLSILGQIPTVFGITTEQSDFFETKIRPVLAESCYDCHNSVNKKKAGLALDYRDALLAGSENGDVIEPGNPEDSPLFGPFATRIQRCPPKDPSCRIR